MDTRRFQLSGLLIVAALLLMSSQQAWAFVNPDSYRSSAPEHVAIEVVASHVDESNGISRVSLTARVLEVYHSATNLKPGDSILIVYQWDAARLKRKQQEMDKKAKQGWVGPQVLGPPPILKSGDIRVAHLASVAGKAAAGKVYSPGAYQYSFEPEAAMKRYRESRSHHANGQ